MVYYYLDKDLVQFPHLRLEKIHHCFDKLSVDAVLVYLLQSLQVAALQGTTLLVYMLDTVTGRVVRSLCPLVFISPLVTNALPLVMIQIN